MEDRSRYFGGQVKARVQVWESEHAQESCANEYKPEGWSPMVGYPGLVATFDMNPHDLAEWNVLRERMLRAVEARQCIVVSG